MNKFNTSLLSIAVLMSLPVYSMEETVLESKSSFGIHTHEMVYSEVDSTYKSVQIIPLEDQPINISFDPQNGLKFEKSDVATRITTPENIEGVPVQDCIKLYYEENSSNNLVLNLIGIFFQQGGKTVYCQDFKDGTSEFTDSYFLVKNGGYGINANQLIFDNVMWCFVNAECKQTVAPSSTNVVKFDSVGNNIGDLLLGLLANSLNNHQSAKSDNSVEKSAVFKSLEFTPKVDGFSSGWINGIVDFKQGIFDLTLQGMNAKITLKDRFNFSTEN